MKQRIREPSTWAGAGLIAHGLAEIFGLGAGAAAGAAQAVETAGGAAAGGNWPLAAASLLAGAAAILAPEIGAQRNQHGPG